MFPDVNYALISRPIWANTVTIIITAPIRCEEYEPIHSFLIFFFAIIFLKSGRNISRFSFTFSIISSADKKSHLSPFISLSRFFNSSGNEYPTTFLLRILQSQSKAVELSPTHFLW